MTTILKRSAIRCLSAALILVGVGVSGCATKPAPAPVVAHCPAGEINAQIVQLFFGRNTGKAPGVSEADWDRFLEKEVMSRFPEGLSVIDTSGVWKGDDGGLVHELGKAVVIVLTNPTAEGQRLTEVRNAYKEQFAQESVVIADNRSCVAF